MELEIKAELKTFNDEMNDKYDLNKVKIVGDNKFKMESINSVVLLKKEDSLT